MFHQRFSRQALNLAFDRIIPGWMRLLVRRSESGMVALAAVVGALAGVAVYGVAATAQLAHELFFGLQAEERLSGTLGLPVILAVSMPLIGGLLLGLFNLVLARTRSPRPVDPIEANALHGGRLSLTGSIIVVIQTWISNAFGASVGLEAAYSQIGSGIASRLGLGFHLRRADLRLLVGCGSAGAIAGAFSAPLTGAFYAFEIIIGTYAVSHLAPVAAAAIAGTIVTHLLGIDSYAFVIDVGYKPQASSFMALVGLGLFSAAVAILVMLGVAMTEKGFRRLPLPIWLMPGLGGLMVGGLALITPQVLSSGHGALVKMLAGGELPMLMLGGLILLKGLASSISLGSGFRGGLFFASLFLGALIGQFYLGGIHLFSLDTGLTPHAAALTGMAALAASVMGGPLTMSFLVLEMTGDFQLTAAVLLAVIIASITVRETFGYSFATWRFHLRGEAIRSAHDIGWARDLTVGRVMRKPAPTVDKDASLVVFRNAHPLGTTHYIVAVDTLTNRYAGLIRVADAYQVSPEIQDGANPVGSLALYRDEVLTAGMTLKEATERMEGCEAEALAVVDEAGHVIGLLSEAHALRRYAEAADRARRDLAGGV
ncbi:chloride channel protein [Labrys neptuniae]|uniref:Chloride channel protein n=1 Tax=Labrys neptuniae TaxID=376174 RepID=A0ABV3PKF6_9HYPH|nr:chloride channel protein [Labrys neptuniae]MDT3382338.1 chloride channel protein [Labrys neptuniae]